MLVDASNDSITFQFISLTDDEDTYTLVKRRVADGNDDAEQQGSFMYLDSSDLELVYDGTIKQTVGMRFNAIPIPRGATITSAYVQFTAKDATSGLTSLTITGEDSDHAVSFQNQNISSRRPVPVSVPWAPPGWTPNAAGPAQRTPEIRAIIERIVDGANWSSGNSLAIIIPNTSGMRRAWSFEGNAARAPLLYIGWAP
jgi:hypothetical protein